MSANLFRQYEDRIENAYQRSLCTEGDDIHPDLIEQAKEELTAEEVARLPLWARYHFEFVGQTAEMLTAAAREYVENNRERDIRERAVELGS